MTVVSGTNDSSPPQRFNLHQAFAGQEEQLSSALRTGRRAAGHPTVQGDGTEMHWQSVLTAALPSRYQVSRAIVIDSTGGQSEQIDLVVRDGHFSPLFWEWGGHLYVPAESVYAVFEVKPEINRDNVLYAGKKVSSVRNLHRTSSSFGWEHPGRLPAAEGTTYFESGPQESAAWGLALAEAARRRADRGVTAVEVDERVYRGRDAAGRHHWTRAVLRSWRAGRRLARGRQSSERGRLADGR